MNAKLIIPLLLYACFGFTALQNTFNRSSFYQAITGKNLELIDTQLAKIDKLTGYDAFKGTLLMKKAGLSTDTKEKLRLFKTGHRYLESSIARDSVNAEYRFLRLVVQENAPKIVNYNKEIKKDASYLRKNYNQLSPALQQVILEYSRSSGELKPGDLKNAAHG